MSGLGHKKMAVTGGGGISVSQSQPIIRLFEINFSQSMHVMVVLETLYKPTLFIDNLDLFPTMFSKTFSLGIVKGLDRVV